MLADGRARGGEVIFTFDGDEAGKAAARRAYVEDQAFAAQTFVAVDPHGKDPCDLRVEGGDEALQTLIASRVPLFEFVLRSVLLSLNLDTAEGRVQGLRAAAPILAGIKDRALQTEYARQVAGWLGLEPREVERAMYQSARTQPRPQAQHSSPPESRRESADVVEPQTPPLQRLLPDNRGGHSAERLTIAATLQRPLDVVGAGLEGLTPAAFADSRNQAMFAEIVRRGGLDAFLDQLQRAEGEVGVGEAAVGVATQRWVADLVDGASPQVAEDLTALMVMSLPVEEDDLRDYAQGLVRSLVRRDLEQQGRILQARLARLDSSSPESTETLEKLWAVERRRRAYMSMEE